MISFNLVCKHNHRFEGWFRNSDSFNTQRDEGKIECPVCTDCDIRKELSAPNISTGQRDHSLSSGDSEKIKKYVQKLQEIVEKNYEDVGDNFAHEARKIHYGESAMRNIYGQAKADDIRDLIEEEIDFSIFPWKSDKITN